FAHRGTAEHHDLAEQERSSRIEVYVEAAPHARPVEQDRLLRQPAEMCACGNLQRYIQLRCLPWRAVDLFRSRRGQRQLRTICGCDLDVEAVAAGDTSGGVDE